ncbi:hypothetical protein [Campylobacter geochelonis]|uniref:Uncharacterized protein n=1 Tax=Campylobacter geochelonis TaxID=1780362 RepID=A0A128EI09_9BACT|nr:hypothetical protein [Campylobacter geochelonis]QKF71527.1 hypothetical protein CGEO_1229 [Campylobacter geochelonis]CZE48490.1 Uncharacterised protein [Campylobacter geochelonis]CZE50789.1 Uncharacterised protein [Campylobacter geochelonis]
MNLNFKNWEEFSVDGASVPFYKKADESSEYIGFETTSCTPPGPMVNAMFALNLVKDKNTKVVMINHKFPAGLIPKIEDKFDYLRTDLDNGAVKIEFSLKDGAVLQAYDTNQVCHG